MPVSDEYLFLRRDVLRAEKKAAEERAALKEQSDRIEAKLDALIGVGNNLETSFQQAQISKKELIIVFLQTNDKYLNPDEYPSRALAAILSDAIGQTVSHVYAGRIRKGLRQ